MLAVCYGTLMRGKGNNHILSEAKFVETCVVRGYKLYDSGFPVAAVSPEHCITGEVWEIGEPSEDPVAARTLMRLDRLEGCRDNDHSSMYHRLPVKAFGGSGVTYDAEMYVGNPRVWTKMSTMRECNVSENTYSWSK